MSINSDMRSYTLQENRTVKSPTGAKTNQWVDIGTILACLYQTSNTLNTQNVRYNSSTHVGFAYYRGLEAGKHRLSRGGAVYDITSADSSGKLACLLLKAVNGHGG